MNLHPDTLPALLAGTARRPLPAASSATPLQALALAAQTLRFALPPCPTRTEPWQTPPDTRTLLPSDLRRPLLRLLAGKPASAHPALAVAEAFDRLRLRPHPFDFHALQAFLADYSEQLGTTAEFWVERNRSTSQLGTCNELDEVDPTTWTQATPRLRVQFLQQQRQADPAQALALLEAVWSSEPAELRSRLLATLQTRLGSADSAFLADAAKDRAPSVRALAQRLQSRLPGATVENPALKTILERITRTEAGLLRHRPVLELELPATVKEHTTAPWLREAFADISFDELANALSLDPELLLQACAKDPNLLLGCALMASTDARPDRFDQVTQLLPNAWELLPRTGLQTLPPTPYPLRRRWAEALVRPYGRRLPYSYPLFLWLHQLLRGLAPDSLFDIILSGSWLDDLPEDQKEGPQWPEILAALCPPVHRQALHQRLETFDPSYTTTALPLLDILIAMENTRPHA